MRAVIALDGSPLHTVAVVNLLRLVDHRTSLDRMTVGDAEYVCGIICRFLRQTLSEKV